MNVADDRNFYRHGVPRRTGRQEDRFHLIYHGTMAKRYGLDVALIAVALARRTDPRVYFTLHGRGEYSGVLQELAVELDLQDHVHFSTQFMTTGELAELISTAELGIVPYRDGVFTGDILPTKLMEYAALGIPCIASRTRGIAAYFTDASVLFVTPGDVEELARSISMLARDRERLSTFARNVEVFNSRFNWADHGEIYVRLVEKLAGHDKRR